MSKFTWYLWVDPVHESSLWDKTSEECITLKRATPPHPNAKDAYHAGIVVQEYLARDCSDIDDIEDCYVVYVEDEKGRRYKIEAQPCITVDWDITDDLYIGTAKVTRKELEELGQEPLVLEWDSAAALDALKDFGKSCGIDKSYDGE